MYIYNKTVGINMRKPFADGNTGEDRQMGLCHVDTKEYGLAGSDGCGGGNGRTRRDKALRSDPGTHEWQG